MYLAARSRVIWLALSVLSGLFSLIVCTALPHINASWDPPSHIVISEIAWSGTAASPTDEWIELHNRSQQAVNLDGWRITSLNLELTLHGTVAPGGFFLLERSDDDTISDIPADQIYTGLLSNLGDTLQLFDGSDTLIDSANKDGGPWPSGTAAPDYRSMERVSPWAEDDDAGWAANDGVTQNGLDALGSPINGTPRSSNSHWLGGLDAADLVVTKDGPGVAQAGSGITYVINLRNSGNVEADGIILTDILPSEFSFIREDSGLPVSQPISGTLVWRVGSLPTGGEITFSLGGEIGVAFTGVALNQVRATTISTETLTFNNQAQASTMVFSLGVPYLLIDAAYYDSFEVNEPDEAIRLLNIGSSPADLGNWSVTDGVSSATFPEGSVLAPGEGLWISKSAEAFFRQFGFYPGFESSESTAAIPNLLGSWPGFSNSGDEVILIDPAGLIQDVLVYEGGNTNQSGWDGSTVQPYTLEDVFDQEGQILYRKRFEDSDFPVLDSNSASDWAQDTVDPLQGRRVQYPGWDLDLFLETVRITETTPLEIAIAPDNAFELISREIAAAQDSILIAAYSFRNAALSDDLLEALSRGVSVTLLLEGQPNDGLGDQERYFCMELEEAGGECWFMAGDHDQQIFSRYRNYRANYWILDDQKAMISTITLDPECLPHDDQGDGTWGSRGLVLLTSSASVVEHLQTLWGVDFDPAHHLDLIRWSSEHPVYGLPPPGTVPITTSGGSGYSIHFPSSITISDATSIEILQSPENSLNTRHALLGLVDSLGPGDMILAEEEVESPYWGELEGNPASDPNPRLESLLGAARRGAMVRLLLDNYNDEPLLSRSNVGTCRYLNGIATAERLDLRCTLANPTGMGIRGSMILIRRQNQGFVHLGSIGGTEESNKGDRGIAVQIHTNSAFEMLSRLFFADWPHQGLLPIVSSRYRGRANYPLISEVLYDPPGSIETEFIELVNPTQSTIDLGGYTLGDAVARDDYEDVRRFPPNAAIGPQQTIVVATTSAGFWQLFGFKPDYEIIESDLQVPNLIDVPEWGNPSIYLKLANQGDEVLLRDPSEVIIDAIGYGTGFVPGVISCPLTPDSNMTLERYPFWKDTDDCARDFRLWSFPNPGELP